MVPSLTLERLARARWGVRPLRIANGIALGRFAVPAARSPGRDRAGTVCGSPRWRSAQVKNLPRLVRAVAGLNVELVIAGEGPERAAIKAEASVWASATGCDCPAFLSDPARLLTHADLFALSSDSDNSRSGWSKRWPPACGGPRRTSASVRAMVAEPNRPFIAADEDGLSRAIAALAADDSLRRTVGEATARGARSL